MHVGFLLTDGVKMSKSLGNSILAKDVIARHSGNAVRLFFYQSHYRAPVNYTEENLAAAKKATEKYHLALLRGRRRLEIQGVEAGDLLEEDYRAFLEALSDDLNVANALTIVDKEVKMLNALLQKKESDLSQIGPLVATLTRFFDILGFSFPIEPLTEPIGRTIGIISRHARKDFATSDLLRSRLMEKGVFSENGKEADRPLLYVCPSQDNVAIRLMKSGEVVIETDAVEGSVALKQDIVFLFVAARTW